MMVLRFCRLGENIFDLSLRGLAAYKGTDCHNISRIKKVGSLEFKVQFTILFSDCQWVIRLKL